jgi:quinol monooxygenase YgiN
MLSTDRRTFVRTAGAGSAAAAFMRVAPANAADDALYVIAELVAKPDKADDLRKLLVDFVASARKEPGCKHYSLLEDRKQAGRFLTFETWADQAAIEAHIDDPGDQGRRPDARPHPGEAVHAGISEDGLGGIRAGRHGKAPDRPEAAR